MADTTNPSNSEPKSVTGRILITGGTGFVGGNIREALGDHPCAFSFGASPSPPVSKA